MKKGMISLSAACLLCAALFAPVAAQPAPTASEPAKTSVPAIPAGTPDTKGTAPATDAPISLTGSYKHEKDHFSMLFEGGKCYGFSKAGDKVQANCFMKGQVLYLQPIVDKGRKLVRNVWVAYQVFDDRLVYSHVEDLDNGQVLYKDSAEKAVLIKQK